MYIYIYIYIYTYIHIYIYIYIYSCFAQAMLQLCTRSSHAMARPPARRSGRASAEILNLATHQYAKLYAERLEFRRSSAVATTRTSRQQLSGKRREVRWSSCYASS